MQKEDCEYRYWEVKDIAKLIRQDLKTEFGRGIKFSVTSNKYPRKISVEIKAVLDDTYKKTFEEFAAEWAKLSDERINTIYLQGDKRVIKGSVYQKIRRIIDKYNYDNCDYYTDYYDVNYYTNIW
mgnify:CR=1 FL=1